ncbi:MAG: class I SAM-dependent methyltransferase [Chloroflexi bacterium HGW-Chloroflexi-4]|jgi:ubiquinone/menaquinone biosynthesis C-methylase UbiE|nr:MAG: class I SAM-dependent methyltransferase [Chloroflexi bacterium HGW-Chloroflexi-4]
MEIRESGMPELERWESFFDPNAILLEFGLSPKDKTIIDLGCGYGTFTVAAAEISLGDVYAFDNNDGFLDETRKRAANKGLFNVHCILRDIVKDGVGCLSGSADFVMLFNILHAENPVEILQEAYRVLVPLGRAAVIHWNYDSSTPRGPSMEIRPTPEHCQTWMKAVGFELIKPKIDFPPYHYGILGIKSE